MRIFGLYSLICVYWFIFFSNFCLVSVHVDNFFFNAICFIFSVLFHFMTFSLILWLSLNRNQVSAYFSFVTLKTLVDLEQIRRQENCKY